MSQNVGTPFSEGHKWCSCFVVLWLPIILSCSAACAHCQKNNKGTPKVTRDDTAESSSEDAVSVRAWRRLGDAEDLAYFVWGRVHCSSVLSSSTHPRGF